MKSRITVNELATMLECPAPPSDGQRQLSGARARPHRADGTDDRRGEEVGDDDDERALPEREADERLGPNGTQKERHRKQLQGEPERHELLGTSVSILCRHREHTTPLDRELTRVLGEGGDDVAATVVQRSDGDAALTRPGLAQGSGATGPEHSEAAAPQSSRRL